MGKENIVLIGMPGSGKSTIGPMLAESLGKVFIDTDTVIIQQSGREPKDIVRENGMEAFLKIQEDVVLALHVQNHVIATGGSMVYSDAAMNHLKEDGVVVYLALAIDELTGRLSSGRRLARQSGQSFYDLWVERDPLYRKYAEITVDCTGKDKDIILETIKGDIAKIIKK